MLSAEDAPAAVRLVFNDAGTYDEATKTGGMDGSIVLRQAINPIYSTLCSTAICEAMLTEHQYSRMCDPRFTLSTCLAALH